MRRAVAVAAIALTGAASAPDPQGPAKAIVADIRRLVTPRAVDETFELTLGGARQVVNVRGTDRANPILLFVHGGPGAVELPIAWSFQRPWEDFFTVVQWDQRGAGRSYSLNDPAAIAPTLTPARYRDDAIELITALTRRYGQRKVIVLGHSWGSVVGLSVALARPDLLHAYVGVGQAIDWQRGERVAFEWTLGEARRRKDRKAIVALEALRPYPKPDSFRIEDADAWRKYAIRYGALAAHRDNADFYFDATRLSPDYTAADRKAWSDGSAFSVQTLWPRLRDVSFAGVKRIDCPTFFFLGRHDHTVEATLAADWLRAAQAPRKEAVWFEDSAHLPMIEEPGRMLVALVEKVRPLAEQRRP